ncbi:hypothetical protein [Marinobacterium marinum]|nr:hypothetical protein [Marinobacterium marinum]
MMLLSGCQLLERPVSHTPDNSEEQLHPCADENAQVIKWLDYEHRYISSTLDEKRKLLIEAEKRQQTTLHALLLSAPGQSPEQLKRALEYLSTLKISPSCSAGQYVQVRTRQLQLQLNLLDQQYTLERQVDELQRQVDALTDLERQITRQREEH